MFKRLTLAGMLLISILLANACSPTPAESSAEPQPEIAISTSEVIAAADSFQALEKTVVFVRKDDSPTSWDVYVQPDDSDDLEYYTNVTDLYESHYHNSEFHNGHVYLVRRIGDPAENEAWSDDLWRYDAEGNAKMLFTGQGLDFRVADSEEYIAVSASEQVSFLDGAGIILSSLTQQLQIADTGRLLDGLIGWSDDGQTFWLETGGPDLLWYGKVSAPGWELITYDIRGVGMKRPDCEVNPNTGKVVFSDYPMFFEVMSQQEFEAEGTAVTLSLYDFESGIKEDIAISAAKQFDPTWLDNQTIEYNDPLGDGRLTFSLP